jgi:hypothetical protein
MATTTDHLHELTRPDPERLDNEVVGEPEAAVASEHDAGDVVA